MIINIDIQNLILAMLTIISFLFGFFVFYKNPKSKIHQSFFAFVIPVVGWSLAMFFFREASTSREILFWVKVLYVSATLIPATLLIFALCFPREDALSLIKIWKKILTLIPPLVISVLVLVPGFVIEKAFPGGLIQENSVTFGSWYPAFFVYLLIYFSVTFLILFLKFRKEKGQTRLQIKYVLLGIFIAAIFGNVTNLILPTLGIFTLQWLGPVSTVFMVVFMFYGITKYHLLDIKVVATEILATAIPLALLIDVLLSKTFLEVALKGSIFVFSAIFSVLLIRSVLKEVRTRERLSVITENLKEANQKLQELDKAKSEFISIASHQLRTPLSSIRGFLSMILEGDYGEISEVVRDKIEKTLQNNERLIRLVDDLLSVSRMEEGRMKYVWTEIDFAEMVKSVFEELKMHGEKKGLEMNLAVSEDKIFIKADETKLRQVVLNLIDNSIKYTEQGSIAVSLKIERGQALFRVKDTGIGIPKEDTLHLFQKFARGESSPRLWTEGLGLGLYVALMIVEEHGGRIGAESKGEGQGSEFWVRVPIISEKPELRNLNSE